MNSNFGQHNLVPRNGGVEDTIAIRSSSSQFIRCFCGMILHQVLLLCRDLARARDSRRRLASGHGGCGEISNLKAAKQPTGLDSIISKLQLMRGKVPHPRLNPQCNSRPLEKP